MKYYRLLRNNKETGPFSAEDLIKAGFKPYDLIWEEGKSAAWRYPSELADFKDFAPVVEEQPFDRFYKKSKPTIQSKLPDNESISVAVIKEPLAVKKEKPRIRIKAECNKIETIKQDIAQKDQAITDTTTLKVQKENIPASISVRQQTIAPQWQNAWLDWEEEKKAAHNLKSKIEPKPVPEIETKFSQSLDDIKELYVEKVLNGKKASFSIGQYQGYIGIGVIVLSVLAVGIWLGVHWSDDEETKQHLQGNVASQEQLQQVSEPQENTASIVEAGSEKTKPEAVIIVPAVDKNNAAVVKNKFTKRTSVTKTSIQPAATVKYNNLKVPNPKPAVPKTTANGGNQKSMQNTIPAESNQEEPVAENRKGTGKSIEDYVSLREIGNSATGSLSYKLENVSDVTLEMVMIDLQYYDAAGRFKKGETIYVRNIGSGQSVSVKAPNDANASKITSKISMISSEQNNLYLIAD